MNTVARVLCQCGLLIRDDIFSCKMNIYCFTLREQNHVDLSIRDDLWPYKMPQMRLWPRLRPGHRWRELTTLSGPPSRLGRETHLLRYLAHLLMTSRTYTVWVKKIPPPRLSEFFHFFHKRLRIFHRFLHTYYTFLCTLDYKCLSNYLQLWRSYAILSATT